MKLLMSYVTFSSLSDPTVGKDVVWITTFMPDVYSRFKRKLTFQEAVRHILEVTTKDATHSIV